MRHTQWRHYSSALELITFCSNTWNGVLPEEKETTAKKLHTLIENLDTTKDDPEVSIASWRAGLSEEGKRTLDTVRAAKLLPTTDAEHIDSFGTDFINGLKPNVERGQLTQLKGNS